MTSPEGEEACPVLVEFTAATVKRYAVPSVRPVTVAEMPSVAPELQSMSPEALPHVNDWAASAVAPA